MVEVREVLRLWLAGHGLRPISELSGLDRKTVRRYVEAGQAAGLVRAGEVGQLDDQLVGAVVAAVRPARPSGHGGSWERLVAEHEQLKAWVDKDLTVVKIHELLERRGVLVPYRTLHRYCQQRLDFGRKASTVRVDDGAPGGELQVDFGRMGLILDPGSGRRRVVHALIFTAVVSRHTYVWLSYTQTLADVIAGCEAAWEFFGGVFKVMIPDNLKAVVHTPDSLGARISTGMLEYAQERGFVIDPARVRTPTDKPRVERTVPFVRNSLFAGEEFFDLAEAQRRAEDWCRVRAGLRMHGTTFQRPAEHFAAVELGALLPAPTSSYDVPIYRDVKVHRDHHVEVAKALYSMPTALIGQRVQARADSKLVKLFHRGQLIKVHPRKPPGGRSTDRQDLPKEKAGYAMRDINSLSRTAAGYGESVGIYATALLDVDLPWTRMRQVHRLIALARRYGGTVVDTACARALEVGEVNVTRITRMVEQALENVPVVKPAAGQGASSQRPPGRAAPARFARDAGEFGTHRHLSAVPDPLPFPEPDDVAGDDAVVVGGDV